MWRFLQTLQRTLVALAVVTVGYASPGCGLRPAEGAPGSTAAEEQPVLILEPQIPEYTLLVSRRRQDAIERAARIRQWESAVPVPEARPDRRRMLYREQALRRERLADVADLVPRGFRQYVLDAASRFEVEPRLLAAVGTVESKWHTRALGRHGDTGLMQILPGTAAYIARGMGLSQYDLFDPVTNLNMGAWYLHTLHHDYGSWGEALAAYNGGPKGAPLGERHPYALRVMQVYRRQGANPSYVKPFSRAEAP